MPQKSSNTKFMNDLSNDLNTLDNSNTHAFLNATNSKQQTTYCDLSNEMKSHLNINQLQGPSIINNNSKSNNNKLMHTNNNNNSNIYLLNTENNNIKDNSKNEIRSTNLFNPLLNEIFVSNSNLFDDEYTVTENVRLINISDHFDINNTDLRQHSSKQEQHTNNTSTCMMDTTSAPSSVLSNGLFSNHENHLVNNETENKKG
jgi:hypothetical protein